MGVGMAGGRKGGGCILYSVARVYLGSNCSYGCVCVEGYEYRMISVYIMERVVCCYFTL